MSLKSVLLTVLLCAVFPAMAQIQFEKGYFIGNNGSRTECYIENQGWKQNPTSFTYKMYAEAAPKVVETIKNVQEFGIYNYCQYKRLIVNIDRSNQNVGSLSNSRLPEYRTETLFLETLLTGRASLYAHNDGQIYRFFYETPEMPAEQLLMKQYLEGTAINVNNQFRQQLYLHVRCDNTPNAKFETIGYNKGELMKHFERYNSCFEDEKPTEIIKKEENHKLFALRLIPGLAFASMKVEDPYSFFDASTTLREPTISYAIEAEFTLAYNKNSWALLVSPSYTNFKTEKDFTTQINNPGLYNDGDPVQYHATARYASLDVAVGLRHYFYLTQSSRLLLEGGYAINFTMGDPLITIKSQPTLVNADVQLPLDNKNYFFGGFGYAYKKCNATVRYNTARDVTEFASWKARYSSLALNIGYQLL